MSNDLVPAADEAKRKRAIQARLMKRADRVCKALSVARQSGFGGFHDEWEYTVIAGRLFICRAVLASLHDIKLSIMPVADFLDQYESVVDEWERVAAE